MRGGGRSELGGLWYEPTLIEPRSNDSEIVQREVFGPVLTVWVNCFLVRDLTAPFGGVGISGIGREGRDYALHFYSDLKTLQVLDRMERPGSPGAR